MKGQIFNPPKNYTFTEQDGTLLITRKWFKPITLIFLAGAIFFLFHLIFYFFRPITNMERSLDPVSLIFLSIPALIGLSILYSVIANIINKTHITVSDHFLKIVHTPLPWPPFNKEIKANRLKQIYTIRKVTRNKNGTSISYRLYALLSDNKKQKLLSGLDGEEEALYIEQEIERYLGIEDEAVGVKNEVR